jgi:hypothetical protein
LEISWRTLVEGKDLDRERVSTTLRAGPEETRVAHRQRGIASAHKRTRSRLDLAEYPQQSANEPSLFLPDRIEFALIQPEAIAGEALVDSNIAEGYLLQLHAALRTLHEVQRTRLLALFRQKFRFSVLDRLPEACGFLPAKIFFFSQDAKHLANHAGMLVIAAAEHDVSFPIAFGHLLD